MFLPEFNSTQMQKEPGKVFNAASKEPIVINRRGEAGVVMLSKNAYADLVKKANANSKA